MYEDSLTTLEDELNLIRRENEDLRDEYVSNMTREYNKSECAPVTENKNKPTRKYSEKLNY